MGIMGFLVKLLWIPEKCPYSELFWSAFSRIPTEYREILSISPYSVRIWENTDQNNSEHGQFLRIVFYCCKALQLTCLRGPWLRQYYSRVFFGLIKTQICVNIFIGFHYSFCCFWFFPLYVVLHPRLAFHKPKPNEDDIHLKNPSVHYIVMLFFLKWTSLQLVGFSSTKGLCQSIAETNS